MRGKSLTYRRAASILRSKTAVSKGPMCLARRRLAAHRSGPAIAGAAFETIRLALPAPAVSNVGLSRAITKPGPINAMFVRTHARNVLVIKMLGGAVGFGNLTMYNPSGQLSLTESDTVVRLATEAVVVVRIRKLAALMPRAIAPDYSLRRCMMASRFR